jgi:hypothetical protein
MSGLTSDQNLLQFWQSGKRFDLTWWRKSMFKESSTIFEVCYLTPSCIKPRATDARLFPNVVSRSCSGASAKNRSDCVSFSYKGFSRFSGGGTWQTKGRFSLRDCFFVKVLWRFRPPKQHILFINSPVQTKIYLVRIPCIEEAFIFSFHSVCIQRSTSVVLAWRKNMQHRNFVWENF